MSLIKLAGAVATASHALRDCRHRRRLHKALGRAQEDKQLQARSRSRRCAPSILRRAQDKLADHFIEPILFEMGAQPAFRAVAQPL